MKKFLLLITLFAGLALVSCEKAEESKESESKASTAVAANSASEAGNKLLFFMNPNGRPCQIQDDNLKSGELKNMQVEYIKTTVKGDRKKFYEFGVRSLPQLILVDNNNNIIKRFSPGIQSVSTINSAIN